jgi:hypothetical protein
MKNNVECQRECRARKKKYGRYITIFVPNDIADKIKGKPSVLIQSFLDKEELIRTIISMDKEIISLNKEIYRIGMIAKECEKELRKAYLVKRRRELYNIKYDKRHRLDMDTKKLELYNTEIYRSLTFYEIEAKKVNNELIKHIGLLKEKLRWIEKNISSDILDPITELYNYGNEWDKKEIIDHIKEILDKCQGIYKQLLEVLIEERRKYDRMPNKTLPPVWQTKG